MIARAGADGGPAVASRRYIFLDRDGTLVEDPGYVHRLEDFALRPGVVSGLAALQAGGFRLAIVTNQSGIGRGYFERADFERFQAHLLDVLAGAGIEIDATFVCPHAPGAGCACRKPRTELLEEARRSLDADLARSWVVGDSPRDIALARAAGCRSVLLRDPAAPGDGSEPPAAGAARDLVEAAALILRAPPR